MSPGEHEWWMRQTVGVDNAIQSAFPVTAGNHWHDLQYFAHNLSTTARNGIASLPDRSLAKKVYAACDLQNSMSQIKEVLEIREDEYFDLASSDFVRAQTSSVGILDSCRPEDAVEASSQLDRWTHKVSKLPPIRSDSPIYRGSRSMKAARKVEQFLRAAFIKSFQFLERIIGSPLARRFIKKIPIEVSGQLFNYRITLKGSPLGTTSWNSTSLEVCHSDGGRICKVCIYTPGVPILDHVASLILHVQSGEELDLLITGNPYRVNWDEYPEESRFVTGGKTKDNFIAAPGLEPVSQAVINSGQQSGLGAIPMPAYTPIPRETKIARAASIKDRLPKSYAHSARMARAMIGDRRWQSFPGHPFTF
jgi:hypothetical protein